MGVFDRTDTCYLETSPAEIDRLIAGMKLDEEEVLVSMEEFRWELFERTIIGPLPGAPDFMLWPGLRHYRRRGEGRGAVYHLITDTAKTRAYIKITST